MGRRGESTRAGVMAVGVVICGCVGDIGDVPSAGITKWRVGEQLADLSARSLLRALGEAAGHLLCALGSVPFSVHELVGDRLPSRCCCRSIHGCRVPGGCRVVASFVRVSQNCGVAHELRR